VTLPKQNWVLVLEVLHGYRKQKEMVG